MPVSYTHLDVYKRQRTVSFDDLIASNVHQSTDNFGTIIVDLRSTYTVKSDLPVYLSLIHI